MEDTEGIQFLFLDMWLLVTAGRQILFQKEPKAARQNTAGKQKSGRSDEKMDVVPVLDQSVAHSICPSEKLKKALSRYHTVEKAILVQYEMYGTETWQSVTFIALENSREVYIGGTVHVNVGTTYIMHEFVFIEKIFFPTESHLCEAPMLCLFSHY